MMSIGNKIFELRTAKNLSQGNLADLLDVSRQSVSKWETDAAIPELDKLIKLCDVFGVTLDELTGRAVSNEMKASSQDAEKGHPMNKQIVIGYILLAVSLIAGLIMWIFSESKEELYILIPIVLSILTCSLVCLFVKQNAGYWCAWAIATPFILLSPHMVGLSVLRLINIMLIIFAVIMFFVAGKLFAGTKVTTSRKKSRLVLFGWMALIALHVFSYISIKTSVIDTAIGLLPYAIIEVIEYIGISLLLTYTVCYLENLKKANRGTAKKTEI